MTARGWNPWSGVSRRSAPDEDRIDDGPTRATAELRRQFVEDRPELRLAVVLVVVDQPASIGALPLAVARDAGCEVAYLPGLAMRRIADLYPGEAKTDAVDTTTLGGCGARHR